MKQKHGGSRLNAGAKPKYTEPTKTTTFRIPISKIDEVKKIVREFLASYERKLPLTADANRCSRKVNPSISDDD